MLSEGGATSCRTPAPSPLAGAGAETHPRRHERSGRAEEGVPPEWEERVRQALASVTDPCCKDLGLSVVDMGLLEGLRRTEDGLELRVVLTTGWCPFTAYLFDEMRDAVEKAIPEAGRVRVQVDWGKAWTTDRLSPRASKELLFLPPPQSARKGQQFVPPRERAGG
ncbi:protein of unknown function DUF59 [Thermaerobacter marianensis DSM 12885]|uniref:MIP18 family-like domain-containing protein n=1 Tax=Thermaerobacter marianensis (strain ATCC 700841 / DSM 12885 / JCM 10246 / 7p75a) TaxID=644966 RepID=E6SHC1_THEM7|nr:metal-sulfur cluster assembly factor [Thermaerobacter marianensis]ADU50685.1 protein of unknown function DUF59 [Thermaerobacter marianensis DSM 12885]